MSHIHYTEAQYEKLEKLDCTFRTSQDTSKGNFDCWIIDRTTNKILLSRSGATQQEAFNDAVAAIDTSHKLPTEAEMIARTATLEEENARLREMIAASRAAEADPAPEPEAKPAGRRGRKAAEALDADDDGN